MIRCIVFGRVSSARQDYTAQINKVKSVAIDDGFKEDEIKEVKGKESAIKLDADKRQTLKEMNDLIEENPSIEAVYLFAVDRLSRHVKVILDVAEDLATKGINLVFLNPNKMCTLKTNEENGKKEKDYFGWMLLAFLSVGAEMEMKIKIERSKNKKQEMLKNNEVICKVIYGYKNVNRKAKTDPITAPIVKWIFKTYNEGSMSLTKIFEKGVELGYWNNLQFNASKATHIRSILKNYAYCGLPTKNGFVYPKIVEKEEVDKAIEMMKQARSKAKTTCKVVSLGKGKVKDAKSGYSLIYDGNHLKYYLPAEISGKIVTANINFIDFFTWREASRIKWNLLANKDDNTRKSIGNELDELDDRIYNIQKLIDTEVTEKYDKVYRAYIKSHGRMTDEDYEREVREINKVEKKYNTQIESLQQMKVELTAVLEDINREDRTVVDPMSVMEITDFNHQKEIVDEVIDTITVERTEKDQIIKVYNKYESKPTVYINRSNRSHIELYEVLNDDMDAINITDEYKPRYRRSNKR